MRKWACVSAAIFLLVLIFIPSVVYAQDFTINSYNAEITIYEDSSFIVKEAITTDFAIPKHGIYRDIPFRYRDELGNTLTTPLKVISVTTGSGEKLKYRVNKNGNVVTVKIGDADKYVSGVQKYVIEYKVENAVLFLKDQDQLYWNVTGNDWDVPIKEASAKVFLAVKTVSKNIKAACYTGTAGSTETAGGIETGYNTGQFNTTRELNAGEGLTIVFGWDKGIVSPPSALKKFIWALNLQENWIFVFPVIALIVMFNLWYKRGRDPKVRGAVPVMYEPPKFNGQSLTPAEAGTLVDEKMDPRDITSAIVGLAVKGYIKIEEIKKDGLIIDATDFSLTKIKESGEELSPFEKLLMDRIFIGMPDILVSDLRNKFYTNLDALRDSLYDGLVSKKYFLQNPQSVRSFYLIAGFIAGLLIVFTGFFFRILPTGIFAGILTCLCVLAFMKAMPAKTRAGALAHNEVLGFQEFLNRAEKDRLEKLGDKQLFSKFLPYAIALDVTKNWARAFEGVYQEKPDWYVSHGGIGVFHPYMFGTAVSSMAASVGSAMFSAPRGSGSGSGGFGGGFSGGGFGGGGGGSW
ncbi:MAG: DUF2207 domain-containing protein [Eubacteriales bacterium]|jgi:uncharacterized membrane protein